MNKKNKNLKKKRSTGGQKNHDMATIKRIGRNEAVKRIKDEHPEVVEIFCHRSKKKDNKNKRYTKVTVVGVITKDSSSDAMYHLQIAFSRRNLNDDFVRQLGFGIALERAVSPNITWTFNGRRFITTTMGPYYDSNLYDIFLDNAKGIIERNEEKHIVPTIGKGLSHKDLRKLKNELKEEKASESHRKYDKIEVVFENEDPDCAPDPND